MVLIRRSDYHSILFLASYPDAGSRHFLAKELRFRLTGGDERIKQVRQDIPQPNPHVRRRWWKTPLSSLLHRSTTFHDENDNETDSSHSSKEKRKNRRVRPDMIRRIDDRPKLINPSGWISEGRMPTAQEGLVESRSTRSRPSLREPEPTIPTLVQSPGPFHSQPSSQQPDVLEVESESELEDLNQIPPRGRRNRRVSDPGAFQHRKFSRWRCLLPIDSSAASPPQTQIPLYPPQPRSPSVTRTQTVEFAPSPQVRGRHQTKLSVDRSNKRQPSMAESRIQPSISNAEGHVEIASKSLRVASCRMRLICP